MDHIYQASDLASKRRELLDAAREGYAQIRDTDGTGLVLVRQGQFELLQTFRRWLQGFVPLVSALERPPSERRLTDYGEFAWLASFDVDDQLEFRREFSEALVQSMATDTAAPAERCLREWRTTARALANEKSRKVLTGAGGDDSEFEETDRPE